MSNYFCNCLMGPHLLDSYCGAQIFEIYGLGQEVVDLAFCGSVSKIGGLTLNEVIHNYSYSCLFFNPYFFLVLIFLLTWHITCLEVCLNRLPPELVHVPYYLFWVCYLLTILQFSCKAGSRNVIILGEGFLRRYREEAGKLWIHPIQTWR